MVTHIPWMMLLSAFAVAGLEIWNLASASRGSSIPCGQAQGVYLAFGLLLVAAVALVDYKLLYQMALPAYVLNILALLALRVIGHKAKGAESWFVIGPIDIQPAEY